MREGRIVNTNEFIFNKGKDVPETELLRMFVLRYYDSTESIPHELIVEQVPEDAEVIESWLTEKLASNHGAKVHFTVPQRGEKNALMAMANKNARHVLMRYKARSSYDDDRINAALLQLESALALDAPPLRIECFDISTIMVVIRWRQWWYSLMVDPIKANIDGLKFVWKLMKQMTLP